MPPEITGGGHIVQALEAALWAFHRGETFREGALLAANLGRDSDVVAAVYGQLAGAYHGVSAIPGIWRNSLMKQEVVIDTCGSTSHSRTRDPRRLIPRGPRRRLNYAPCRQRALPASGGPSARGREYPTSNCSRCASAI